MLAAERTGRVLQVHPTRACNLRCEHCYSSSGPEERGALAPSLLRDAVTDAAREGYDVLSISGGEPLLYRSLGEIADAARAAGMSVTVTTNGLLLDGRRADVLRASVDMVAISLDGRPERHDRMRGRRGAFADVLARVEHLRTREVPFGFVFTLTEDNVEDLPWAADLAIEEGARLLQIHPLEAAGRAAGRLERNVPDPRSSLVAWALAAELERRAGGRLAVHVDLLHLDFVCDGACGPASDDASGPFAELVSPLVVEADGTVSPLQHGFPRGFALGNLHEQRLSVLMDAYRGTRSAALRRICGETMAALTGFATLPLVNWHDAVAHRAATSHHGFGTG